MQKRRYLVETGLNCMHSLALVIRPPGEPRRQHIGHHSQGHINHLPPHPRPPSTTSPTTFHHIPDHRPSPEPLNANGDDFFCGFLVQKSRETNLVSHTSFKQKKCNMEKCRPTSTPQMSAEHKPQGTFSKHEAKQPRPATAKLRNFKEKQRNPGKGQANCKHCMEQVSHQRGWPTWRQNRRHNAAQSSQGLQPQTFAIATKSKDILQKTQHYYYQGTVWSPDLLGTPQGNTSATTP